MSLRLRRLTADAAELRDRLEAGGPIRLVEAVGEPPERYRLEYIVPGLVVANDTVVRADRHQVEIFLTLAYPRQAPQCRMLSPVFHPNIAPHAICIGDNWSAAESLLSLVVRIAEMLCYQSYNVKSPLNGDAARWAEEHIAELPLDGRDFWKAEGAGTAPVVVVAAEDRVEDLGGVWRV